MATDLDRWAVWALSPAMVLGVAVVAMLVAALFGAHPMWQTRSLNISEAAAARDVAIITLLLERGADPNARWPIRAPLLDGRGGEMTPLEAGVAAGRLEVVDLLLTRGAAADEGQRVALACEALRRGHGDVAHYLVATPAAISCPR